VIIKKFFVIGRRGLKRSMSKLIARKRMRQKVIFTAFLENNAPYIKMERETRLELATSSLEARHDIAIYRAAPYLVARLRYSLYI